MSKIVVTSFTTMDGVVEAPEKWSIPYWNNDIERFKDEELRTADAQLLGRSTYEIFSEAWPSRSGHYADRLNETPKYVVRTRCHALTGTTRTSLRAATSWMRSCVGSRSVMAGACSCTEATRSCRRWSSATSLTNTTSWSTRWCSEKDGVCLPTESRQTWSSSARRR